jgi:hypothetical protein
MARRLRRILLLLPLLFTARLVLIVLFLLLAQARTRNFNREQLVLQTYRRNCYPYRYPYRVLWLARGEESDWRAWTGVVGCVAF